MARERISELEAREAQRARAEQVQAALYRIAETASAVEDMAAFYAAIHEIVGGLMYAENFYIALYDERRQLINYPYFIDSVDEDIPDPNEWIPFGIGDASGGTAHVLRHGQPEFVTLAQMRERAARGEVVIVGAEAEEWIGVPLRADGHTIGVVSVQTYREDRTYSPDDLELLTFVGQHIATALTRARAIEETRQRNAELAVVNEVGAALAEQLDFASVITAVGDRIRTIFQVSTGMIGLYDEPGRRIAFPYVIDGNEQGPAVDVAFGSGLSSTVIATRQPLRLNTAEDALARGAIYAGPSTAEESWLGVPILAGDRVLGVITLERLEPYGFSDADERLLSTLASSMGQALENARLFDETRRLLGQTEQRNAELAVITEIGAALARQLDFDAITELVGERVRQIFTSTSLFIGLYDPAANMIRFPYEIAAGKRIHTDPIELGAGLTSVVIKTKQALRLLDERRPPGLWRHRHRRGRLPVVARRPHPGGRARHRGHCARKRRTQCLHRRRRAPPVDARDEHGRRPRERAPVRRDEAAPRRDRGAGRRAGGGQQRAGGPGAEPRHAGHVRPRRRQDPGDLRCTVVDIGIVDRERNRIAFPYTIERGVRFPDEPIDLIGIRRHVVETRQPLLINRNASAEAQKFGQPGAIQGEEARSVLFAPLVAGGQAVGVISLQNLDREGAFSESDVRLLTTLAASLSVALENARLFDETRRLLAETDERAAELAVVNSVQEGLARNLNMQAMYDLVGDKIQEIFDAQVVDIGIVDRVLGVIRHPYTIERGVRFPDFSMGIIGIRKQVLETRQPLLINENAAAAATASGQPAVIQGDPVKSSLWAPLIVGDEARGVISLQNLDREHAFSDADVRLLTTLAATLSVALENARLFDETKRLLAETDERVAELAVVNSVQQGLAERLDMQSMYELVGDKIREIFDAQGVSIEAYDLAADTMTTLYMIERGERLHPPVEPMSGLARFVASSRVPIVINEDFAGWLLERGLGASQVGDVTRSGVFAPLVSGNEVRGVISLQNMDREHAFSPSNVRLLSTLAASLSVALENARLFDETKRLLAETDERAAELAVVNSVQQGLSANLDMQAMYDLVGDKIREIFDAQVVDIGIFDFDAGSSTTRTPSSAACASPTSRHRSRLSRGPSLERGTDAHQRIVALERDGPPP